MNLTYMLRRADKNLQIDGEIVALQTTHVGSLWGTLRFSAGATMRIPSVLRLYPFRSWPDTCGWYVIVPADGPDIHVSFCAAGTHDVLEHIVYEAGSPGMKPLRLPWPQRREGDLDLVVRAVGGGNAHPLLLANRMLDRSKLLGMLKGVGIEIGPGPSPQILPAEEIEVSYLEQMPPVEWNRLYNQAGRYPTRPELWDNYVVGDAAHLPCEDESLDFIFGSHVFEHLANPIGHLERWRSKLRCGGRVACVIPDIVGAKDYLKDLSTIAEWRQEYEAGIWEPLAHHYSRHFRMKENDARVRQAIGDRESVHVHYYTNTNCADMMEYACRNLGYATYSITWTPNHKDLYFVLDKA